MCSFTSSQGLGSGSGPRIFHEEQNHLKNLLFDTNRCTSWYGRAWWVRGSLWIKRINESEKLCSHNSTMAFRFYCFFFSIAYPQMTVLDWHFSVQPGSYRRRRADRRWVGARKHKLGSWPEGRWVTHKLVYFGWISGYMDISIRARWYQY